MDKRIGAQFYTLRDHTKTIEDFDATCKRISEMGYKIVQISGTPLAAKEIREVLDKYGLQAFTTHRSAVILLTKLTKLLSIIRFWVVTFAVWVQCLLRHTKAKKHLISSLLI